jgi:hypothetical protein
MYRNKRTAPIKSIDLIQLIEAIYRAETASITLIPSAVPLTPSRVPVAAAAADRPTRRNDSKWIYVLQTLVL